MSKTQNREGIEEQNTSVKKKSPKNEALVEKIVNVALAAENGMTTFKVIKSICSGKYVCGMPAFTAVLICGSIVLSCIAINHYQKDGDCIITGCPTIGYA